MQKPVTIKKTYVDACVNWLLPLNVSFRAIPKALTDMTETEPTVEQIEIKIKGFFFPCIGATR
jgi:hypothetical protein